VFLLDTNICIDFIDGRSANAERRVRENFIKGLNVSIVTVGELLIGSKASDDPEGDRIKVERFLSIITVHDFDRKAADVYAEIARTISVKRSSFDRLIAAHALSLGLILVTNNQKHFADVPGLKVENWTA
jgi:tRNA(fMet)-specific endonuclease VapC